LTTGIAEDFARELAKGMESLMREMGGEDLADSAKTEEGRKKTEEEKEKERLFKAAWEAMLIEGMNGQDGTEDLIGHDEVGKETDRTGGKDDFQKTIRQAMEKLKESESTLQADSTPANPNADSLEALLAQFGAGGDGESEEELHGLLETMMGQLMSKEVLYEPLKELHDKLPKHLKDHPELPADEKRRYESQYQSISKIIALFDNPGYKEDDPRVVELMTEMQSFGSPPPEIMGPMPPGFGFGPDGTPQIPDGCIVA